MNMRYEYTAGKITRDAKSLNEARECVIPYYLGYLKAHDTQMVGVEIRSEHHQRVGSVFFQKKNGEIEITWKDRHKEYLVNRDGTLSEMG